MRKTITQPLLRNLKETKQKVIEKKGGTTRLNPYPQRCGFEDLARDMGIYSLYIRKGK